MIKVPSELEDIKNRLRKVWIAILLVIFLVPVAVVSAVSATGTHDDDHGKSINGRGTITFTTTGTISGPTAHGEQTIVTVVKETLKFSGNLSGTALTIERQVKHNDVDDGVSHIFTTFHGHGNFTGTLNGASVKLHIRYEGISNSTFTRGNFVVFGDTSQNVRVHAEGHFHGLLATGEGGSSGVTYTMHSHVGGHEEHPETDDDDRNDD